MTSHHTAGVVALGLAIAGLWGCSPSLPRSPGRTPIRWIVVEKRTGEVTEGGWVGDGRVDPQAVVLTMQPLYREDLEWEVVVDPHDYFVELLEITPGSQATPGETVSAKVRVGKAQAGVCYRLVARPSSEDVHIVGEADRKVLGGCPTVFQFTSLSAGRGGITIGVETAERDESR